jgi:hypothetical protein
MRKLIVSSLCIVACLMGASPSQAQKITHATKIWAQSSAPAKAEKVKCSKYHSPFVKIPKFKLVKKTCEELYMGASSLEFKAEKIYRSSLKVDFRDPPFLQMEALRKTLKNSVAKGWTLWSIYDSEEHFGWTARLTYTNQKTSTAIFADVEVKSEEQITGCMDPPRCSNPKGKSWVTISVTNLHQEMWE